MLFYLTIVSGLFLIQQTKMITAVPGRKTNSGQLTALLQILQVNFNNIYLLFIVKICTTEPDKAPITNKKPGESFQFVCPLRCAGDHVFEHYNEQAEHLINNIEGTAYSAIITIASHSDAGTYRCSCRDSEEPSYCYLKVHGKVFIGINLACN